MALKLKDRPALYPSARLTGDILEGDDAAKTLIETCTSGDDARLKFLLSEPHWTEVALSRPHRIYGDLDLDDEDDRKVCAKPTLNLEFLLQTAARHGRTACMKLLLEWAPDHDVIPSTIINRSTVVSAIRGGDATAFGALAAVDPTVVSHELGHGLQPLTEAVLTGRPAIVSFLLEHGASLSRDDEHHVPSTSARRNGASLVSAATWKGNAEVAAILLSHGAAQRESGAIQRAAGTGNIDVMEVLVRHGADVNERLPEKYVWGKETSLMATWTPMHYAAAQGQAKAVKWLKDHGAESDITDKDGKTPSELLRAEGL